MASNPLVDIFRIRDLRNRVLFTLGVLVVHRIGSIIPIPGIDMGELSKFFAGSTGESQGIVDYLDFFSGGAFKNFSIFMLGVMPYITTSIIMQVLMLVFPALKRISEEEQYRRSVASKKSCPGVGWLSATRFTLEWGGLERFPTGKRFASYTGLTASEYSTGETIRRGRITGQSNPYVRSWLIECAWRAIKRDPALFKKFTSVYRS